MDQMLKKAFDFMYELGELDELGGLDKFDELGELDELVLTEQTWQKALLPRV